MALTGLQIQKLLPGTNCKECGSNTCMAFAMKLASKKIDIAECPYASDEAIATLGAATEPPIKKVTLGTDNALTLGEETVLYRHEKTFVNQNLIAINIDDTDTDESINKTLDSIKNYSYERVGEILSIDMVAITDKSGNKDTFTALAKKAHETTGKPVILRSTNIDSLKDGAEAVKNTRSIVVAPDKESAEKLIDTVKECGHVIAITGNSIDEIIAHTMKLRDEKFTDIIIHINPESISQQFQLNSIARIAALKDSQKGLGFPLIKFINTDNYLEDTVEAVTDILKFGGITVIPDFDEAQLASIFTMRLNIYTDPQKPIQVEPKVYPIGEPDENSPVFVTTNFSLTYFVVSGEIENSGQNAWLLIPECEGMSVLTAWAAGKFNANSIASWIKEIGLEDKLKTKKIIVPGYVAQISGELEELLPDWQVIVGPQEASDMEGFIKVKLAG